jgi:hypothetical protein
VFTVEMVAGGLGFIVVRLFYDINGLSGFDKYEEDYF